MEHALKALSNSEIKSVVISMLESSNFTNSKSASYIINDYHDHLNRINGVGVKNKQWKYMLTTMGFTAGMSSSNRWINYSIEGGKNLETGDYALGLVNIIWNVDIELGIVSNSMTINYRKLDGRSFTVYVGNVEDFFSQVMTLIKPIYVKKTANKYNV